MIFPNQLQNGEEIAQKFQVGFYGILLAQMQSGKTGSYLACAKTMLESGQVKEVVIISGSSDTSLREQAKSDAKQVFAGTDYSDKVTVMFSQDIKTFLETPEPTIDDDTLLIHEECHMAQSKNNRPNEYYEALGLDGALKGDFSVLKERNIRILAVSATPFSELTSNEMVLSEEWKHLEKDPSKVLEGKFVYPLKPGDGYIGIQELYDADCFRFEARPITDDSYDHINKILCDNREKYDKSFVVIRTRKAEPELLKHLAQRHGYTHVCVFGDGNSPKGLDFMERQPKTATIVQISGRFRMGQVVPKRFIRMTYEQTLKPNADTILQGLPGRMCGYTQGGAHIDVDIYVSVHTQTFFKDYAESWTTNEPHKLTNIKQAMNLKPGSQKVGMKVLQTEAGSDDAKRWIATVPIPLNIADIREVADAPDGCSVKDLLRKTGLVDIHNILSSTESTNPDFDTILGEMCEQFSDKKQDIHRHLATKKTDKDIQDLETALRMNQRLNTSSGKRTTQQGLVKRFSLISDCKTKVILVGWVPYDKENSHHTAVKESTLAEVVPKCNFNPFAYVREDGEKIVANGGQTINFPRQTATDPQVFREELIKSVLRSIPGDPSHIEGCQRSVTTNYDGSTRKYVGLHFAHEVYSEELIGEILARVESVCDVKIKTSKAKGKKKAKKKASPTFHFLPDRSGLYRDRS